MNKNTKKKVDLFIIGTHKSGTTTLVKALNQHPDVFIPDREMHHFERDFIEQRIKYAQRINRRLIRKVNILYDDYMSYYIGQETKGIWGDKSPSYLYSSTAASEIYNYNSAAKLIVMFREPLSYLESLHSQNLFNLIEPEKSFERALNRSEDIFVNKSKLLHAEKHMVNYRSRVKYAKQLQSFLGVFPSEQIHIIITDELHNDFQGVVSDVYRFIGVDAYDVGYPIKANRNKMIKYSKIRKAIRYASSIGLHEKLLSKSSLDKLKKLYNKHTIEYCPREALSVEKVCKYKQEFKKDSIDFINLIEKYSLIESPERILELWYGGAK